MRCCRQCRLEPWKVRNPGLNVLSLRCLSGVQGEEINSGEECIDMNSRGEWSWTWKSGCQQQIDKGFPGGSEDKESAGNVGDPGSIPGLARSPGEGNSYPLQYSCLENPMDRGDCQATVHGIAKSWTIERLHFTHNGGFQLGFKLHIHNLNPVSTILKFKILQEPCY